MGWILGQRGTGRCRPSFHLVQSSGMSCDRDDKVKVTSLLSAVPGGSGDFWAEVQDGDSTLNHLSNDSSESRSANG